MSDAKLDLEIRRLIAAPREKLWRSWSEPAQFRRWWAAKPWVTELQAFDLRGGGAFHPVSTGPDGGKADFQGLFAV